MLTKKFISFAIILLSYISAYAMEQSQESNINTTEENQEQIYQRLALPFKEKYQPKSLKFYTAKALADNNSALNQIPAELVEYVQKFKEINSRNLNLKLKNLFLECVEIHSLEEINFALDIINKIDTVCSKEKANYIKDRILSNAGVKKFTIKPSFMILFLVITHTNSERFHNNFNQEITQIKEYYNNKFDTDTYNTDDLFCIGLISILEKGDPLKKIVFLTSLLDKGCIMLQDILAMFYVNIGNIELAKKHNRLALEQNCIETLPIYFIIWMHEQTEENEKEAIKYLNIFTKLGDNEKSAAYLDLGLINLKKNNIKEAKKYFKLAVSFGNLGVYRLLYSIYLDEGNIEKAAEYRKKTEEYEKIFQDEQDQDQQQ